MTPEEIAKIDEAIRREQTTPAPTDNFSLMNRSNIFRKSKAISSGQINPVRNFVTAYGSNGNPILQRGISSLQVGGNTMSIPNAVLQQIQAEDAANNGRADVMSTYFGKAGTG